MRLALPAQACQSQIKLTCFQHIDGYQWVFWTRRFRLQNTMLCLPKFTEGSMQCGGSVYWGNGQNQRDVKLFICPASGKQHGMFEAKRNDKECCSRCQWTVQKEFSLECATSISFCTLLQNKTYIISTLQLWIDWEPALHRGWYTCESIDYGLVNSHVGIHKAQKSML